MGRFVTPCDHDKDDHNDHADQDGQDCYDDHDDHDDQDANDGELRLTLPGTDSGGTNKESQAITTNTGDICAKSEQTRQRTTVRNSGLA